MIDNKEYHEELENYAKHLLTIGEKSFVLGDFEVEIRSMQNNSISLCTTKYYGEESNVDIPSEVVEIGQSTFKHIKNREIKSVTLPKGLKEIGINAFSGLPIKEIVLPDSVEVINDGAFSLCGLLKKINLPENLKYIGKNAFERTSIEGEVTFPSSLIEIGDFAFNYCELTKITFSEGLKVIHTGAFRCNKVAEITFPSSLKEIGKFAFDNCVSLKRITFSDGLEVINDSAFTNSQVEVLEFPSTLRKICGGAFEHCKYLNNVIFHNKSTEIEAEAFYYTPLLEKWFQSLIKEQIH